MASCTSSGGMLSWLSTALASCRLGSSVSGTTAVAPAWHHITKYLDKRARETRTFQTEADDGHSAKRGNKYEKLSYSFWKLSNRICTCRHAGV